MLGIYIIIPIYFPIFQRGRSTTNQVHVGPLQVVLNLAAEWRPEALRQSPEQARQLNVDAAGDDRTGCSLSWLCHFEQTYKDNKVHLILINDILLSSYTG